MEFEQLSQMRSFASLHPRQILAQGPNSLIKPRRSKWFRTQERSL